MRRQGDLLFVETEVQDVKWEKDHDGVLAEGEVTGHRHQIVPQDMGMCRVGVVEHGPRRVVIEAVEKLRIAHPEHQTVTLPRGRYEMIRQREWVEGVARQVAD